MYRNTVKVYVTDISQNPQLENHNINIDRNPRKILRLAKEERSQPKIKTKRENIKTKQKTVSINAQKNKQRRTKIR